MGQWGAAPEGGSLEVWWAQTEEGTWRMGRSSELMQKGAPRTVLSWAGPARSGSGEGAVQWQKSPSPAHRIMEGALWLGSHGILLGTEGSGWRG